MEEKRIKVMRFALPTKDGTVIGIPMSQKDIEMVNRWAEENPDKFEPGAEGVLMALNDIRKQHCE